MSKSMFSNVNLKKAKTVFSKKNSNLTDNSDNSSVVYYNLNPETRNSNEFILIQNLLKSEFAIDIQNVIKYYYNGQFSEVLKILTKVRLEYLLNILYSYKKSYNEYPTYENIRLLLKYYLEGLTKSIDQFLEISNLKIALSECEEHSKILDDMTKLQEYIDKLNRTMNLFKTEPVCVAAVKILPEHATYLRMYGYPVGGIFDIELLNAIKLELLDNTTDTSLNILL